MIANATRCISRCVGCNYLFIFEDINFFLVCATIFNKSTKIIDIIDSRTYKISGSLVRELYLRKIDENIYYIDHYPNRIHGFEKIVGSNIFSIPQLVSIFRKDRRNQAPCQNGKDDDTTLSFLLLKCLKNKLPLDHYNLIELDLDMLSGIYNHNTAHGGIAYLNMRYKIQKKLNLKNRFEYGVLISTIFNLRNSKGFVL